MFVFVVSNTYCVVLCFCSVFLLLVYPMLPVSLDCPFLIAPSVFSSCNVYLSTNYIHKYMLGFVFIVCPVWPKRLLHFDRKKYASIRGDEIKYKPEPD
jgi:hypothetical protein